MKKLQLLILITLIVCSSTYSWSQVFGYPGATWTFYRPDFHPASWEQYEKWTYTGDTIITGDSAKIVHQHSVFYTPVMPPHWFHGDKDFFFKISGDTVFLQDTTQGWVELYNFSLEIGDTVHSPLKDAYYFHETYISCDPDTVVLYNKPTTVINTGTVIEDGISLRFYTLQYSMLYENGFQLDTMLTTRTYFERYITGYSSTDSYWYPWEEYPCGNILELLPTGLVCYQDIDMNITGVNGMDSLCNDLTWFDHVSVKEENQVDFRIYPNPAHEVLIVQNNEINPMFYQVISLDGKLVLNNMQSPINIGHLPSGIYFITDQNSTGYRKFIKN